MPQPPAIRVDKDAKGLVKKEARHLGITDKELTSRVLKWFGRQDHAVKLFVLGLSEQREVILKPVSKPLT